MDLQRRISRAIAVLVLIFPGVCPANAHKTEVSGDIAGTWHIEPDHNPTAGEPAQVWIALTQRGGNLVPLEACDCRLMVYAGGSNGEEMMNTVPMMEPQLQAIAAETYRGIPGAEIIFPQVGQYHLTLIGRPKADASFQPFELTYTVTVATGSVPAAPPLTSQSQTTSQANRPTADASGSTAADVNPNRASGKGLIGLGVIALLVSGGVALRLRKATRNSTIP